MLLMADGLASHVMFAATGVTDGSLLHGVHFFGGGASTQSVVMRSKSGTVRFIEARHHFDRKPAYGWMMTASSVSPPSGRVPAREAGGKG